MMTGLVTMMTGGVLLPPASLARVETAMTGPGSDGGSKFYVCGLGSSVIMHQV